MKVWDLSVLFISRRVARQGLRRSSAHAVPPQNSSSLGVRGAWANPRWRSDHLSVLDAEHHMKPPEDLCAGHPLTADHPPDLESLDFMWRVPCLPSAPLLRSASLQTVPSIITLSIPLVASPQSGYFYFSGPIKVNGTACVWLFVPLRPTLKLPLTPSF